MERILARRYLKWICGFANAQGGKIYIGKKDNSTVIGVSDARKLMEDIQNKIQNKLGIVADVNLLTENGAEYIEIAVSPWSFLVNYDGEDIMVKFRVLQSAIVSDLKVPKHQSTADFGALDDALVQKILEVLRHRPEISQGEIEEELGTTRRVIQKKMILLKEAGRIERIGGKRYGHWIIHERTH